MNGEFEENSELLINSTNSIDIDQKLIDENNFIWTGFHKKAFKERLHHVN